MFKITTILLLLQRLLCELSTMMCTIDSVQFSLSLLSFYWDVIGNTVYFLGYAVEFSTIWLRMSKEK